MSPQSGVLSPLGLALWLAWSFAVLASIQLTVRLIRAFSIRTTFVGALALTIGTVPIILLFSVLLQRQPAWYPLTMILTGAVGFLVADYCLRIKRLRGRVIAAIGVAVLSGPWPAFLDLLPR